MLSEEAKQITKGKRNKLKNEMQKQDQTSAKNRNPSLNVIAEINNHFGNKRNTKILPNTNETLNRTGHTKRSKSKIQPVKYFFLIKKEK